MLLDNKIAYISFFISVILAVILILIMFDIVVIDYKYATHLISTIIFGFSQIYHKFKTIPITEAISDYWKYKIKKQDKSKPTGNDYASFKDAQNKDKK